MKIVFVLTAFLFLILTNVYVALRGWQSLSLYPTARMIYLLGVVSMFISLFVVMILGQKMPIVLAKALSFGAFTYLILFMYLLMLFVIVDLIRLGDSIFHFLPFSITALRQWSLIGSLGFCLIIFIIGNYRFNHPKVVKLDLEVEHPTQNKTLRIVAASDIHLGFSIDKKRLQGYVKLINDQHPDVVLLVGDVSDRPMEPIIKQKMYEEIKAIQSTLGVFAINGNHEHYAESLHATEEYLTAAGVHFLRDKTSLVANSFYIVGRDDKSNVNRKPLAELVAGLDPTKPKILLDHQPYNLEQAEQNGIDLQLSGHTHNGQFFPGNLFVKRMYELGYGYLKKGKTHYYVSSGLGLWGPQYRIGTQSEIVVINLKY